MDTSQPQPRTCPRCYLPAKEAEEVCSRCAFPVMLVAGKYQLARVLGMGGYGTVYLARHIGLSRDAERVVKVIRSDVLDSPEVIRRFYREVELTASLSQKNRYIVRTYDDFGEQSGLGHYYVMEYLEGETLRDRMTSKRLSDSELRAIFGELCEALDAAHEAGVIHRDLKPSNVFLVPDGDSETVKLIDFGLAKDLATPTIRESMNSAVGTPEYMSPEQCESRPVDARTDVYALGVMLYQMLTGTTPFPMAPGENPVATMVAHLTKKPEPPKQRNPSASIEARVDAAILRALSKEPSRRFQSVRDFADAVLGPTTHEGSIPEPNLGGAPSVFLVPRTAASSVGNALSIDLPAPPKPSPSFPSDNELTVKLRPQAGMERAFHGPSPASFSLESLLGTDRATTNLEPLLTSFVGRVEALEALATSLRSGARLVSVLAPGGMGKTRIAIELGRACMGLTPASADSPLHAAQIAAQDLGLSSVWLCDLSEATSVLGLVHEVAQTLSVDLAGSAPPEALVDQVGRAIRGHGQTLVILDNFEQLAEWAAATLGLWLREAPDARFLVTSRQRLHLPEERCVDLAPLDEDAACELFVQRAHGARRAWFDRASSQTYLREIVRRLDGIPLAIELAAARARLLAPAELLRRLDERFGLLRGKGATSRVSTLRGAIDWSWDLLESWEKVALAQCGVFRGGFNLEAAEAIVDLSAFAEAPPTLDVIDSLRDKSLLRDVESRDHDEARFSMYESILVYAREKLEQSGELAATRARHTKFYVATSAALGEDIQRSGRQTDMNRLSLERDNLLDVFQRQLDDRAEDAARVALALDVLPNAGGHYDAHRLRLEAVVERLDQLPTELGIRAMAKCAFTQKHCGYSDVARAHTKRALELAESEGVPELLEMVHTAAASVAMLNSRLDDAERHLLAACDTLESRGDSTLFDRNLCNLASVIADQGRYDEALDLVNRALKHLVTSEDIRTQGVAYSILGSIYGRQGRMEEAIAGFREALQRTRESADRRREGLCLGNLGVILTWQGVLDDAETTLRDALEVVRQQGAHAIEGSVLGNLGGVARRRWHLNEAETLLEAGISISRETGNGPGEASGLTDLGRVYRNAGRMRSAERALQSAIDLLSGNAHNVRLVATAQVQLALLCLDLGQVERADSYLSEARVGAETSPTPRLGAAIQRALGDIAADRGDWQVAREHYEAALVIETDADDRFNQGITTARLGRLLLLTWELDLASVWLGRAAELLARAGSHRDEGVCLALTVVARSWNTPVMGLLEMLRDAETRIDVSSDPQGATLIDLCRGFVDLAEHRSLLDQGHLEGATELEQKTRDRLERALQPNPPDAEFPEGRPPLARQSLEVRLLLGLLRRTLVSSAAGRLEV